MSILALTNDYLFAVSLVFCRIAAIIMLLPLFSNAIPLTRLFIAIPIALLIQPLLSLPSMPNNDIEALGYLLVEILNGVLLGMIVSMVFASLHVAGSIISNQSSLSMAMMFDPAQAEQNTIINMLIYYLTIMLAILMEIDHMAIKALYHSYEILPCNYQLLFNDQHLSGLINFAHDAVISGLKLSMPFVIVSTLIMIVSGVIGKLMPGMQIFFVIVPLQVLIFLLLFAGTFFYLSYYFLQGIIN